MTEDRLFFYLTAFTMKRFIYSSFIFLHALDMSKVLFCIPRGDICFTLDVLLFLIFNIILLGNKKAKHLPT